MKRKYFGPGNMLNPTPVVMVSCGRERGNIITVAWTGTVCSDPPLVYVSIRKERYSHDLIEESGEFVINLVDRKLARICDHCGVVSGRDVDKFERFHLTRTDSALVSCPTIGEAPVSLECIVTEKRELGSHDMYIARTAEVSVREDLIDDSGRIRLDRAGLIAYNHGEYFALEREAVGRFGFSVMKERTAKSMSRQKRTGQH